MIKNYQKFNEGLFDKIRDHRIKSLCNRYAIYDYTINEDGSISVSENVYLNSMGVLVNKRIDADKKEAKLPIKFKRVDGQFYCSNNALIDLEGCPSYISGEFYCQSNQLTSLKGGPSYVGRGLYCSNNKISSFEGFPKFIGGDFECIANPIQKVWELFKDTTKIELFNDYDIIQNDNIIVDRLNCFLKEIGIGKTIINRTIDQLPPSDFYKLQNELISLRNGFYKLIF